MYDNLIVRYEYHEKDDKSVCMDIIMYIKINVLYKIIESHAWCSKSNVLRCIPHKVLFVHMHINLLYIVMDIPFIRLNPHAVHLYMYLRHKGNEDGRRNSSLVLGEPQT